MAATSKDTSNISGNGGPLHKHTFLFVGDSGLNASIPELLTSAIARETKEMITIARRRIWLFSSKGLVVRSREASLRDKCLPYAHNFERCDTLLDAINKIKPTVLIGAADCPMIFKEDIINAMAKHNKNPIIMSASNPAVGPHEVERGEDVMRWTQNRGIFIPAKLEKEYRLDGHLYHHRGLSSAYVSPGIALGALLSGLTSLREDHFLQAAETVASCVTDDDRRQGSYYPHIDACRKVAIRVAHNVMTKSYEMGLATNTRPDDIEKEIRSYMYQPMYRLYR